MDSHATSAPNDIGATFRLRFGREVHEAYLRMGSKLRNTVRAKNNVQDGSTVFQPVDANSPVGRKSALSADPVECVLGDYYAGDWIDKLTELKTNIDERQVIANAGAYALGRKTDELIIQALSRSAPELPFSDSITGMLARTAIERIQTQGGADSLGDCTVIVGWKQWSQLLGIEEFYSAAYVGADELPWRGIQAKRWLGALWIPHSGLPLDKGARRCFAYRKNAVGHAIGDGVTVDVTWHSDRGSHYVNNCMAQGAVVIDPERTIAMVCQE